MAVAVAVCVSGCESPTAIPFPADDAVHIAPRPQYAYWWSLVERCAGRRGRLADITWYATESGAFIQHGESYDGYWWKRGNRILVSQPDDGAVVRHEMLHALLQTGDHPPDMFEERCGGTVHSSGYSATLAAAPFIGVPTIRADSALSVRLEIDPPIPSRSEQGGYFTYILVVTNRLTTPVVVRDPRAIYPGYILRSGLQGDASRAIIDVPFRAGQERRELIDARVEYLGVDSVRGSFGTATAPWRIVTFVP